MVKALNEFQAQHKALCSFVVVLQERDAAEAPLKALAEGQKVSVPLVVPVGGPSAQSLQPYKLDPTVPYTVLVYDKKTVRANFALDKIGEAQIKEILAAAAKLLPNP